MTDHENKTVFIIAGSHHEADRYCIDAGLVPTINNPLVRYIFDADQLRGMRGMILCVLGTASRRKDYRRVMELALAMEARIFHGLPEALAAAREPAPAGWTSPPPEK